MMTKNSIIALAVTAALTTASCATADHRDAHRVAAQGRVLDSDPIYETVRVNRPERRCWDEEVRERDRSGGDPAATVAGAIVGGVVGNQFGRGHGRDAATVAGALLGGAVGNNLSRSNEPPRAHVEERCENVDHWVEEREVTGYRVRYEYQGDVFTTTTREPPGRYIDLDVSVRPDRDGDGRRGRY